MPRLVLVKPAKEAKRTREERIKAEIEAMRDQLRSLEELVTRWLPPEAA